MKTLYKLPHKYTIKDGKEGFNLFCNGNFVYWNMDIDQVFIRYGNILNGAWGELEKEKRK